jgi:glycine cleavage system aminomethyltransferase T
MDNEDKGVTKRDTLGGIQQMSIINESGLIFDDWTISRLDDRRWREEAGEALN